MDFRILGPLSVVVQGLEVPIAGAKVRSLLALLLIRPREAVTAERLADDLWGEHLPANYANALQSLVSKLRRALGERGGVVVTTPNGYMLDAEPSTIDAVRFVEAAQRGRRALGDGDPAEAAGVLRDALVLWRGPALDGLVADGVLRGEATRLDELRLGAAEDRIDADLRLGRHAEVIAELGVLTTAHPLRERLHALLMLALYRAGRQADALRAYQQARAVLADELGLDPGSELRALEQAILDQDPALDVDLPRPGASREAPSYRTNLWRELSTFVGRDADVVDLAAQLVAGRLVTVVGPGGAGKTRLAVEVAALRTSDEDVWFVDLAALRDGSGVADTVAATVGVVDGPQVLGQGGDPPAAGGTMIARIAEHVGQQAMLILLDNCEHVIPDAARVTQLLLVRCPRLRVLATSREALGVRGETVWPVPPMSTADAVRLFVDRAGAVSGFVLDDEVEPTVTELCDRLDGLPLAIELAAVRVRALPVQQLAARLDDRFRLLTGGARTAMPRQQTLRAVVEWSYELLFDDEQRVFERLSVFAGGCTLEAAEAVCAGDDLAVEDIADLLGHLVDKSLLIADHAGSEVRFRLLQTLGLFGRERLVAAGEADAARSRHAVVFGALCRRGYRAYRGLEDQHTWLVEIHHDFDNVRAAIDWLIERGDVGEAQTMLGGIAWRWWFGGQSEQGQLLLLRSLEAAGPTTPFARAAVTMWAGYIGACAGLGMEEGIARVKAAAAQMASATDDSFVEMDRPALRGLAHTLVGEIHMMRGDRLDAITQFTTARDLLAEGHDRWSRGCVHHRGAQLAVLDGDTPGAYAHLVEAVRHFGDGHVDYAIAMVNGDAGVMAMRLGRYADAIAFTSGAREAAHRLRMYGMESLFLSQMAAMATRSGDLDASDRMSTEAITLAHGRGIPIIEAHGQAARAVVRFLRGNDDEAVDAARRAVDGFVATGWGRSHTQPLAVLGAVAVRRGDLGAAREHYRVAYRDVRRARHPRSLALVADGLAAVALAEGDAVRAAMLLGAAQQIRDAEGGGTASMASDVPATRAAAVAILGDDVFAAAVARGMAVTGDDPEGLIVAEIGDVDRVHGEDVDDEDVSGELAQVLATEH